VALKQHQLIEHLREQNLLKDFFQLLARADADPEVAAAMAAGLGCDLSTSHIVLHVVPAKPSGPKGRRAGTKRQAPPLPWPERAAQVEGRLAARFPGVLVDVLERSIRALVPLRGEGAAEVTGALREMSWGHEAAGDALSVGISGACAGGHSFAQGFLEAESAAEVGGLIQGGPGVTAFEDLGPYRYVLRAEDHLRDRAQQRLELLVAYDRKRGTQLLDTLETYLDHRGNVVATSRALFIHSNTLRQRLDRIERESGVDLERENWLTLAIATKVVKLRKMRETAEGRRNDG
jgi:sugar diacid utilization regulator